MAAEPPVKPNGAINLEAAMDLAKYSGLKNVVFISDACRSIPDSRSGASVQGAGAFPNYDEITTASKIDYFKATSDARPAYEGTVGGEFAIRALRRCSEELAWSQFWPKPCPLGFTHALGTLGRTTFDTARS